MLDTSLFCHNVDFVDFKHRRFSRFEPARTCLIRIGDPGFEFSLPNKVPIFPSIQQTPLRFDPTTENYWGSVHTFEFLDLEEEHPQSITLEQAQALYNAIKQARDSKCHIVVHCFAGVCRSGAVVNFATKHMGYLEVDGVHRSTNSRVERLLEQIHK